MSAAGKNRDRGRPGSSGFSLIEVLVVVAIILIIAAIAIPNLLRAKMSANEASAADSVRQITRAQVAYSIAYPTTGYALALGDLGGASSNCVASVFAACLIDSSLSSGQKGGYRFSSVGIAGGSGGNTSFVVGAAPQMFNQTGVRDFCSTNDNVLRAQTGANGNVPVTNVAVCTAFPAVK